MIQTQNTNDLLIIGNGYDRYLGLKTDYCSFLDWLTSQGYGATRQFFDTKESLRILVNNGNSYSALRYEYELLGLKYYDSVLHRYQSGKVKLQIESRNRNYEILKQNFEIPRYQKMAEFYLALPEGIHQEKYATKSNLWHIVFQIIRKSNEFSHYDWYFEKFKLYTKHIDMNGTWISLETMCKTGIKFLSHENTISEYSIIDFAFYYMLASDKLFLQNTRSRDCINESITIHKNEILNFILSEFIEFKHLLTKYLREEQKKIEQNWAIFYSSMVLPNSGLLFPSVTKHKIVSFNYTNYLNTTFQDIYYVHGSIDDGSEIVFGFDHATSETVMQEILNNPILSKFTKVQQLLHLQKKKAFNKITKPVGIIKIIGHSIGVEDYSYFFSLIDSNPDEVSFICAWYKFLPDENGVVLDNEIPTQESLFEMLRAYEVHANRRVLHAMIFEGRIKFIEYDVPFLA